jgi:hypothetical protein
VPNVNETHFGVATVGCAEAVLCIELDRLHQAFGGMPERMADDERARISMKYGKPRMLLNADHRTGLGAKRCESAGDANFRSVNPATFLKW